MKDMRFCRTSQVTDMSQIDILKVIGNKLVKDIQANQVIVSTHFAKD
jgi:hypothetical protein